MGSAKRIKPDNLSNKLLSIRLNLNLTMEKLAEKLSCQKVKLTKSDVSKFEKGLREPSLLVLLRYARIIGVSVESLIDDELELPKA